MKRSVSYLLLCIFMACAILACASSNGPQEAAMQQLASDLLLLTAAVKVTVQTENPPADVADTELLKAATLEDTSLLNPFINYKLRISRHTGNVVLLVCAGDGTRGLLEDVSCTAGMDEHLWKSIKPCEFTIPVEKICDANKNNKRDE